MVEFRIYTEKFGLIEKYKLENSNINEKVLKQFMIPHFNKVEFQHGENTKILRLRQK